MRGATGCRPTSGTSLVFQSTRPMRGATRMMMAERGVFSFQSTRPMRGATLHAATLAHFGRISIHAPLAGCDAVASSSFMYFARFQSTRPVRGATGCRPTSGTSLVFQSTRPMRGATRMMMAERGVFSFQSTRPMRGATLHAATLAHFGRISIHAPLAGCDAVASSSFMYFARFQSTRPVRGATCSCY